MTNLETSFLLKELTSIPLMFVQTQTQPCSVPSFSFFVPHSPIVIFVFLR